MPQVMWSWGPIRSPVEGVAAVVGARALADRPAELLRQGLRVADQPLQVGRAAVEQFLLVGLRRDQVLHVVTELLERVAGHHHRRTSPHASARRAAWRWQQYRRSRSRRNAGG